MKRRAKQQLRSLTTRAAGPAPVPAAAPAHAAAAAAPPTLEQLLHRPLVNLDTPEVQRFIAGKRVLVTGAGGSIGSEICRQVLRFVPERLILMEQAEGALFEVDRELRHRWLGADVAPYIADITDATRVGRIFAAERPHVIFHCAAHKHVPMMELNPGEAIKNNVLGTRTVADAAVANGVAAFVMVSTDKAVNPTSVMGATKRFAELYIQSLNSCQLPVVSCQGRQQGLLSSLATGNLPLATSPATRFVAVRFGNVLGSSGSVVPIFAKQIAAGGPVTVTHPDMRRYFMTIPEASQLVLQAGAIGQGGEIFVLDMGRPVRILDLAEQMIRHAGLRPHADIAVEFTGIRPGEKLFEELALETERTRPTGHPKIRVWELPPAPRGWVERALATLAAAVDAPRDRAVAALMDAVAEYRPDAAHAPALRLVAEAA